MDFGLSLVTAKSSAQRLCRHWAGGDLSTWKPKHVRARSCGHPTPAHAPGPGLTAPVALANLLATSESWLSRKKPSTRGYRSLGTTRRKPASAILRAIRVTTAADATTQELRNQQRWGRTRVTPSRRTGARRKGRAHSTGQSRLHIGGRVKAKSISSFRSHECRHLGKGGARRPPLCEGGALTSGVTLSAVAGKLRTSRALSAGGNFSTSSRFPRPNWDSCSRVMGGLTGSSCPWPLELVTRSPNRPHSTPPVYSHHSSSLPPIPRETPSQPSDSNLHCRGSFRLPVVEVGC